MTAERSLPGFVLVLVAAAGFAWFPGHTWLQSDTQIYAPILEHLQDRSVLTRDMIAIHAHVTWTIYDDVSLGLRRVLPLDWKEILLGQQLVFRFLGLLGGFLLVRSIVPGVLPALLAAGCFGLGAVVNGPAVLTFEYEPVPRTFAVMLLMLALGLSGHGRRGLAMIPLAAATLYHPTTTLPIWAALLLVALRDAAQRVPLLRAAAVTGGLIAVFAWLGPGAREPQPWFGVIDADLEKVQRLRGPYNWIEQWPPDWFWQYFLLLGVVLLAVRRLGGWLQPGLSRLLLALAGLSILTVPLQWVLLDKLKWILMPQFQPARAVLFLTALTVLLGAACGCKAASRGGAGLAEAAAWFGVVYALPANGLLVSNLWARERALVTVALALLSTAVAWFSSKRTSTPAAAAVFAAIAAPFILIPAWGGVRNYPQIHSTALDELSTWAAAQTPADSVFLFATAHRRLEPGIFRANARRALYVDWKGGGQVNIMPRLGLEWWRRWSAVGQARQLAAPLSRYHQLGIDYLVVRTGERPAGLAPVFENAEWSVLPVQP